MKDFRSDTVTRPTKEMYAAMANCVLGDDVYQDDPTVNELESLAAEMIGFEAALFVPSGTFSNQLAIMTHTNRGDEIIVESHAHVKMYEAGAIAGLSGVNMWSIDTEDGQMDLNKVKEGIRTDDVHYPSTKVICIENAYNGRALPLSYLKNIKMIADEHNLKTHLDGARVFNAATALGVDIKEITKYFDTVSVCLSKGLCSPIGSILLGSREFIERARRNRKMMGGGMRQVGVLAACGIVSLEVMTKRLIEDHENADFLAGLISKLPMVEVDHSRRDINMVFIQIHQEVDDIQEKMQQKGFLIGGYEDGLRLAVHNDISKQDIISLVNAFESILSE